MTLARLPQLRMISKLRWLTRRFPHPYTLRDAQDWIAVAAAAPPGYILGIEVNGELAGGISIEPLDHEHAGSRRRSLRRTSRRQKSSRAPTLHSRRRFPRCTSIATTSCTTGCSTAASPSQISQRQKASNVECKELDPVRHRPAEVRTCDLTLRHYCVLEAWWPYLR